MTILKKLALLGIVAVLPLDVSIDGHDLATISIGLEAPARAEVGRPLTPLSYSGVARRTTRRTVRRTTVRVTTLPAGCVYGAYYGAYYYRCGNGYYARSGGAYVKVVVE